ncbi:MAG TPA: Nif3-like dinuclear metal center hexameric protein [Dermatophilaceae bacterium]|nr:Nif3-like dinuclear metal center hexameric protein [Dermatophilaceae bacterium]
MADLTLAEVVAALDALYPRHTAQSWDRVGLVSGHPDQPVRRVHLAVDASLAVIEEAGAAGADLLVAHHPLLLRGIHSVATTTGKGAAVTALVVNDIALYVAHTNADVAAPGVNDALAEAFGLLDTRPLATVEGQGLGRVGRLPAPMSLRGFAGVVARALPPTAVGIRVAGPPEVTVETVAVLGGAGDDQLDAVRASGADVYVTADLRHHPVLEAREDSRGGPPYLLDAGHWASESLWLPLAATRLREQLGEPGTRLDLHVSRLCTDPWEFTVVTGSGRPAHEHPGGPPA